MKIQHIYRIVLFGFAAIVLNSCLVAKNYESPEIITEEEQFRADLQAGEATMADASWSEMFSDPILKGYIAKALENNYDVRVALKQIEVAEAYLKQGKAAFYPSANANFSASHQQMSKNSQMGSFFNGSLNQFELSAGLSWEADIWGKIRSQKRAMEADYLSSIAATQAIKTHLVAGISSSYYQLLAIDKQIEITEETIATREKSVETMEALMNAGIVNAAAIKQSEAQLYVAKSIIVDLKKQSKLIENVISILMGEPSQVIERSSIDDQEVLTELKVGVPSQLLTNRPDVLMAEFAYQRAFEMKNVARSLYYPSLTLSGSTGFQSLEMKNFFSLNSLFANVIGGLTQPIFNQRRIKTQNEVADAEQEMALLRFEEALLMAGKEVVDALYSYEAATEKIEHQTKVYEAFETAYEYSEDLLNNGLANYLEVLTSQENALNSRLSLVNTKFEQLNSIVELYRALGGGWK